MIELSTDELDFFNTIFADKSDIESHDLDSAHHLSVHTQIPTSLKKLLGESKLTLLAEISHYQLWFPVTLSIQQGNFTPILGIPEIIDVNGAERSWRVSTPENVSLINTLSDQDIEILSLSGTGVTLKISDTNKSKNILKQRSLELYLPNEQPVKLSLDVVRNDKNIIAAKFKDFNQGRDSLRQFLFNSHKMKYSELYQDVIL